jgi:DNA mismatch repair ATPase MutS
MKNPLLHNKQTPNPVNLSKNIVITGPNAAGKTTYVKSILSNIILAHTFGICYANKADIILYDSISSFMRISDVLGAKSYFEVEAEYCSKMMKKALELSQKNKKALFLMDEPMHSTPPTEGMSTAFAVAEYIGNLQGANIIITTHFHKLISLAETYPDKFINLCVEAIPQEKGFHFPYTIKSGYSHQCIAIELLSSKEFPESVIQSAINMKNKIYQELNSR